MAMFEFPVHGIPPNREMALRSRKPFNTTTDGRLYRPWAWLRLAAPGRPRPPQWQNVQVDCGADCSNGWRTTSESSGPPMPTRNDFAPPPASSSPGSPKSNSIWVCRPIPTNLTRSRPSASSATKRSARIPRRHPRHRRRPRTLSQHRPDPVARRTRSPRRTHLHAAGMNVTSRVSPARPIACRSNRPAGECGPSNP